MPYVITITSSQESLSEQQISKAIFNEKQPKSCQPQPPTSVGEDALPEVPSQIVEKLVNAPFYLKKDLCFTHLSPIKIGA